MKFAKVDTVRIPKGAVKRITDESGNVVWMLRSKFTIRIGDGDLDMFHINLTVKQGMTWSGFANSSMTNSKYVIIEDGIVYLYVDGLFTAPAVIRLDGVQVLPTDKIYADGAYAHFGSYGK